MQSTTSPVAERHLRQKMRNVLQSAFLLAGMLGLLGASAALLAGPQGAIWVILGGVVGLILAPQLSSATVMRFFGAQYIDPADAAPLYRAVARLASKAGLSSPPQLYFLGDGGPNSFAVGRISDSAIVLTDGMLRHLSLREIVGVLAHEVAHIAHNDLGIMQLADTISRMTRLMAFVGFAVAVVSLPGALFGVASVPWFPLLLLLFAPSLAGLCQFALSRTREFEADLKAASLTGDPAGLASALQKVDRMLNPTWRRLILARSGQPSLLRSHPPTADRVDRLRSLEGNPGLGERDDIPLPPLPPYIRGRRRPRILW